MATTPAAKPLRVVQWATGNIGRYALRTIIAHPAFELVGLWVQNPEKAGRDAGALVGLPDTGVRATNSVDDIVALAPDCVLYMPLVPDVEVLCRLLESGINVVATTGLVHHPAGMDPDLRSRLETACAKGGASIHATGSSPGFITEALPLVLTSIQSRIDSITIDEFADLSQRDSPDLLFTVMGFGAAPTAFDERQLAYLKAAFGPSLALVADGVGLPLEGIEATGEFGTARTTTRIAAGTLEAGTVAAQRITISGRHNSREIVRLRPTWYCTTDLNEDWGDLQDTGWRVTINGDAPLSLDIRMPVPLERFTETMPAYTANRAVNAIRPVVQAAPGIRSTLDLPHLVPHLVPDPS